MVALVLIFALISGSAFGASPRGFHFTEGVSYTKIPFELYKNLIVIPAKLNGQVKLKLILDTGTRSVLLYGKKFKNLETILPDKKIKVSGWGASGTVAAQMAYPNEIEIGDVRGSALSVAVVPQRRFLYDKPDIDGVIGYELFVRFVVEINYHTKTIHLYDRLAPAQLKDFHSVPLEINLARPEVHSSIRLPDDREVKMKLLIDTGSSLGLTLFAKDVSPFQPKTQPSTIGLGLAGLIQGFDLIVKFITLGTLSIPADHSHLVAVKNHPDKNFELAGSLGADFLKDHVVIFDYPRSTLYLKRTWLWASRE